MPRLMLIFTFVLFPFIPALAERCPSYAIQDRKVVKQLFSASLPSLIYPGINGMLVRLSNIAYLASLPPSFINLGLATHRQAFENEYQALLAEIDYIGENPQLPLRRQTRSFLAVVVNARHLGLQGTTLSGATDEEARQNSFAALEATIAGTRLLWACF